MERVIDTDVDYNVLGYHKKETFDTKGDLILIEYFENYDGTTYSDLMVKESRVYTRDGVNGLLTKRDSTIEWIGSDGVTVLATKITEKYYTPTKGFDRNKNARQNLIDQASMYLLSQVGLTDAKAFWKTVKGEVDDYKVTGDLTLITAINDSTEPYMTGTIKATLDTILNITY